MWVGALSGRLAGVECCRPIFEDDDIGGGGEGHNDGDARVEAGTVVHR